METIRETHRRACRWTDGEKRHRVVERGVEVERDREHERKEGTKGRGVGAGRGGVGREGEV